MFTTLISFELSSGSLRTVLHKQNKAQRAVIQVNQTKPSLYLEALGSCPGSNSHPCSSPGHSCEPCHLRAICPHFLPDTSQRLPRRSLSISSSPGSSSFHPTHTHLCTLSHPQSLQLPPSGVPVLRHKCDLATDLYQILTDYSVTFAITFA